MCLLLYYAKVKLSSFNTLNPVELCIMEQKRQKKKPIKNIGLMLENYYLFYYSFT